MSHGEPTIVQKLFVLRTARNELGTARGLCAALIRAGSMYPSPGHLKAAKHLRRYVEQSLEGCAFLEQWLLAKGHVAFRSNMYSKSSQAKMRRTRLAWLDWMIACYEEDLAKLKGQP